MGQIRGERRTRVVRTLSRGELGGTDPQQPGAQRSGARTLHGKHGEEGLHGHRTADAAHL